MSGDSTAWMERTTQYIGDEYERLYGTEYPKKQQLLDNVTYPTAGLASWLCGKSFIKLRDVGTNINADFTNHPATTNLLVGAATNRNMEGSLELNKKKHAIPACLNTLDHLKNSKRLPHTQILFEN